MLDKKAGHWGPASLNPVCLVFLNISHPQGLPFSQEPAVMLGDSKQLCLLLIVVLD